MTRQTAAPSEPPKPCRSLLRTHDLGTLWLLRLLVRLGGFAALMDSRNVAARDGLFKRLRVIQPLGKPEEREAERLHHELTATLAWMEQRAARYRLAPRFRSNLALLGRQFALSFTEQNVLALAVLMRADEDFFTAASFARSQVNVAEQLSSITALPQRYLSKAIAPNGNLRRSGLLQVTGGGSPAQNLKLQRGSMRTLATTRLKSVDGLFESFLHPSPAATLPRSAYEHLHTGYDLVCGLIAEALASGRIGVNILLHGPPGTGKTELTRTIAAELGVPLFEVSSIDDDGDPLNPRCRLAGAATAQRLLAGRQAALVFDEVDAIFNDGSRFAGKPSTAETAKAWVNTLLERTPIPTLWVGNDVSGIDPAFLRRFDLVLEATTPPLRQRIQLLERVCGRAAGEVDLRRLAHSEAITPGVLSRAACVARRIHISGQTTPGVIEHVLDGTLSAQGHPTVRLAARSLPPSNYDPLYCNASEDLRELARGLVTMQSGRLCLYGPPGTGKTALGYWLAKQLDKPLVLKGASDLLSPLVGVMERNVARAFEQAARGDAILQVDEIDSFLHDRAQARQSWEVSQVNEFLTQLEGFGGIFIASTNLIERIDHAAMRRFDYKIRIGYLRQDQVMAMLQRLCDELGIELEAGDEVHRLLGDLDRLTPGDFSVIRRQHKLRPFGSVESIIRSLREEQTLKGHAPCRIGFV
ncbi:MAG: ATP-binding protein [Rhodanobacteraceae bacterium]